MHVALEGPPGSGVGELLSLIRLFFPGQVEVVVGPDSVGAGELAAELGRREEAIRRALDAGFPVVEGNHPAVWAAAAAAAGDEAFLATFRRLEVGLRWPELFVRLELPPEVSRGRCGGSPVPIERMQRWLSDWHSERGDEVVHIDADRAPDGVLRDLIAALGLRYRSLPAAETIPYLALIGRPAAGKSELIQFLKGLPPGERARDYHLGSLAVLDDFPILWERFIEDDIWEEIGKGRLISARSGENYYVTDDRVWPFLVEKLNRLVEAEPELPGRTVVLEFSRGGPRAYRGALERLSARVLGRGAILYLAVSPEESWRRNLRRYDVERRGGILTHSVPREEYERTYRTDDWRELAPDDSGYIVIQGLRIPYVTVENEPEPITPEEFARRFRGAFRRLYRLWRER